MSQTPQTKDIEMVCYKTLPTKSITWSEVGPMSLKWPMAPFGSVDHSSLSSSGEDPMMDTWNMLFLLLHIYAGGAMLFNHLKYNKFVRIGSCVPISLKVVFDVSPGIREDYWIHVSLTIFQGKKTQLLQTAYPEQRHRLPPRNAWEG